MIDTIKIVSMINESIYQTIQSSSIIKTSLDNSTGELHYKLVNDSCEGSYSSNLLIRIGAGQKYNFINMSCIEIEGSYHKFIKGYNSHNGFYNFPLIAYNMIKLVENKHNIKLPSIKHWFFQRADIAKCFDMGSQENVATYINNINSCNYPRRKLKHYEDESIYLTGSTTTLKIYNKLKEFEVHDKIKFKDTNFDINNYTSTIKGFIRFECEIKKKKLAYLYGKKYIRVDSISYKDLEMIWYMEFEKLLKMVNNDLSIVTDRELIRRRLKSIYSKVRANNLFNFYILVSAQGIKKVKDNTDKSMYYKNISDLKKAGIDFSQKLSIDLIDKNIAFNPFNEKEIL